jgi:Ni/Co efflux regulator RcnB
MSKLLSLIVAVMFSAVSASSFAAAHAGAPMKDDKKMEKKAKSDKKKASKKKSEKMDKMDKMDKK